jgi:gliding motility-associated protein GldC
MATYKSSVNFEITLDDNKIPESIQWSARDGGIDNEETKAMLVSVWDDNSKTALRLDLWTKDMTVDDMKKFIHQTLMLMADTLQRSTDQELAPQKLRNFADDLGVEMGILDPR